MHIYENKNVAYSRQIVKTYLAYSLELRVFFKVDRVKELVLLRLTCEQK